ncbi:RDD family protein [Bacillus sp. HSf4]|uniref:RDD family protein n=1 Tax=Bacillus sp. HSf4 TaxID=3035514 RepID=UPI002409C5B6|nr:RDD family protein [Bacillus sp. HSf4]WFA06722.1 RDD family protein [Bacillus sp. HSf4]
MELSKHETAPAAGSNLAGIGSRFLASFIDSIILGIPMYIVTLVISIQLFMGDVEFMSIIERDPEKVTNQEFFTVLSSVFKVAGIMAALSFIVYFLYFTLMESSKWQATLGKKIMGIQVMEAEAEGGRISFGRAAGRFFARSFLSPILMIGYILAFFTEKRQALHDLLAGTIVVKN